MSISSEHEATTTRVPAGDAGQRVVAVEGMIDAILREHPNALVCGLAGDGLITRLPKSVGLWGQAAIEGRALIDHVVAGDRTVVVQAWQDTLLNGHAEHRVRLMEHPEFWMTLHFADLRERHGVLIGILVPTGEPAATEHSASATTAAKPRFATLYEDEAGNVIDCDDAFLQMTGYSFEEIIGQRILDHIDPAHHGRAVEGWLALLSSHRPQQVRVRSLRKDGSWMWTDATMHNFLHDPERRYVLVEEIDVTAEMAAQEAVYEREELLRKLMDTMPDGVFQVDHDRRVVFHNSRLVEMLRAPQQDDMGPDDSAAAGAGPHDGAGAAPASGETARVGADGEGSLDTAPGPASAEADGSGPTGPAGPGEAPARTCLGELLRTLTDASALTFHMALAQVLEDGEDIDVEVDAVRAEGDWRRLLMSLRALRRQSGEVGGALTTVLDVTDSVRARQELERRATYDALTHCYNRSSILAALHAELGGPSREETAVIYVDLDRFKNVNDTHGHGAGDEVLARVAELLRGATRSKDKVGRLGGDEFLLVVRGLPEPDVALGVATRICESLRTPIEVPGGPVELTASLGIAWAGAGPMDAEELIKRADEAMYRSKTERKGLPALAVLDTRS
ncbi:MAG: diguanylate cyclase [Acidobacteriota bacterium]|nr:diguanylate cyclase [Acidobacteriota bacterium]